MCDNIRENLELVVFNDENYQEETTAIDLQKNIDKMLLRSIEKFNNDLKTLYRSQNLELEDTNLIFHAIEGTRDRIRNNVITEIYKAFSTGYNSTNNDVIISILTVISASANYMLDGFVKDFETLNGAFDKYSWDDSSKTYIKT
jgi:hypothetical protein